MGYEDDHWILNYVNAHRGNNEQVNLENAKGMYIPQERNAMNAAWGEKKVNQVFGEPSFLEKAEMLLLKIEEGNITKEKKYQYLIDIVYLIENACGMELDMDNPIYEKYAILHTGIPIQVRLVVSESETVSFFNLVEKNEKLVSVDFLNTMSTRINLQNKVNLEVELEVCFDYIFELVYISLKRIFNEVKAEIMGE